MDNQTHEKYVQLHMDILSYHSNVKSKGDDCLQSIRKRVGFVPREVETQLKELREIQVKIYIIYNIYIYIYVCIYLIE